MKRSEILDTAKEYVTKDRASQHGDAENNLNGIASGWDWWMSRHVTWIGRVTAAMDVASDDDDFEDHTVRPNQIQSTFRQFY
jgi:hypothetical protein